VKYISICSGIEAATVAWHGLGWTPLAFSEIDAFPSSVLSHHYPSVPNLGDMTKYREWPEEILAECDLLVGGTPCQAFSVAGQRRSLDDERGNLSLIYVHLFHHINEVRKRHGRPPTIALWENVPGVLSTKDNAFGCFISGLLGVDDTLETQDGKWPKAGFLGSETVRVGYRILDAQYFAVAQRRRRVFLVAVPCELVASLGDRACPSEILSLRESVLGNPPTRGEARQAVAGGSAGCSNGTLDSQTPIVAFHPTQDPISSVDGSTHAMGCGSRGGCCTTAVAFKPGQSEAAGGTFVTEEFAPTLQSQNNGSTAVPAVAFKPSHYTRGKDGKPDEVAPPLSADADKGDQDTVIAQSMRESGQGFWMEDDIAGTLRAEGENRPSRPSNVIATTQSIGFNWQNGASDGRKVEVGVRQAMQVRRLTPTECCRLQGFPDNHCDIVYKKKPAADGPKYRALGNSMAVPCMAWLGWRIHNATQEDNQ
jgi:DNA (cytosine-5)-methyltransferase 1